MLHSRIVCVLFSIFQLFFHLGYCEEIIGGNEVRPHSLPHMVLLENKGKNVFCGGTLINLKWVLTAAHCADMKKVLLGVHDMNKEERNSRQIRKVTKSVPHPCFDKIERNNDLMLLKLDKPAKRTNYVKPLPMPSDVSDFPAGTICMVAGWGATKNKGPMSSVLRSVNVTVIDRVKCNSPDFYNFKPIITHSMLCAGYENKKSADSCQGDSGGPLVCGGVFGGAASFGTQCGIKTKPGVYTFISKYTDWIKNTIQK